MSLIERKVWRTDKNFSNGSRDINRFNSIGVVRTSNKRFIDWYFLCLMDWSRRDRRFSYVNRLLR